MLEIVAEVLDCFFEPIAEIVTSIFFNSKQEVEEDLSERENGHTS